MASFLRSRKRVIPTLLAATCILTLSGCAAFESTTTQEADDQWQPAVADPAYPQASGPLVLVDAAHGNFHTIDGRFAPFAELLRLDGYRVESADTPAAPGLPGQGSVYVVANAVLGGEEATWALPTPSAFTLEEVAVIADWVRDGGALLLIADHMPFPGSAAALADAFGIVFHDGYAMHSIEAGGGLAFTRASGTLASHVITDGRSKAEAIESLRSFTGQAFRCVTPAEPLMYMPDDWFVYFPTAAGVFDEKTPFVSARGLVQGAALRIGKGRVAVFGEAAMFTAQSWVRDGVVGRMGMNHPEAPENAQFVLNVMHWLTGLLDD
ncbi:MAG: hypothetical protein ACREQZ_08805 [Woeseiaceae bacterium]